MDFEYDEAAVAMGEVVAAVTDKVDPSVVRAAWQGDHAPGRRVWRSLAQIGLPGLLVPEQDGGLGLDELAVPIAFEALGRSGLPVPAVETVLVAAPLFALSAPELLSGLLTGDAIATVATDRGLVPHAGVSDLVVRLGSDGAEFAPTDRVGLQAVPAVDGGRDLARFAPGEGWTVLSVDPAAARRVRAGAVIGTSAVLVGLASRLLDLTVGYVNQREQFGRKIGSFQAIKHHLANAYFAIESARPCVHAAAWYLAREREDADRWVSMAKAVSSEAAYLTCRLTLQAHGGIAYTTEYDHHLFAKRVWALMSSWGSAAHHRTIIRQSLALGSDRRPASV